MMDRLSDRSWSVLVISGLCAWTMAVHGIVYNLL